MTKAQLLYREELQSYFDLMSNFKFEIELFLYYFCALFMCLLTLSVLTRLSKRIKQGKLSQTNSFFKRLSTSVNYFIDQCPLLPASFWSSCISFSG